MSSLATLSGPVKDLVAATIETDKSLLGKGEADQSQVNGWLEKVGQGDVVKQESFKTLDVELTPKTYVVGNYPTAADVALYAALHPTFAQLQPTQYYYHPALTRYFDHIQSLIVVRTSADKLSAFPLVPFDFKGAPRLERVAEAPKKKKATVLASAPAETAAKSQESATSSEGNAQKKEKKEKKKEAAPAPEGGKKKGGDKGGAAKAPAADDGEPVPSMIELRVGHIVDVKKHPDADSLYIEQIDLGEEAGPRTVVSGLVKYIPIEEMKDRYLVCICNLKPANMRGVKSFAMVLAATHKDGKDAGIELITPPPGSKVGDRLYFEGEEFENAEPLSQLNPKKKIFETVQPGFTTLETREAAWINPVTKKVHRIRSKAGVCLAPSFVGASLS